jgi:hypothetical protein
MTARPGRTRHVAAGIVLLAAAVSGCARYPRDWAPRSTAEDSCSTLADRYAATGEYGDPALRHRSPPSAPQLMSYLRPHLKDAPQPTPVSLMDWVDISFDSGRVLRIRGYRDDTIVEERAFAVKDGTLSCGWGIQKYWPRVSSSTADPSPDTAGRRHICKRRRTDL